MFGKFHDMDYDGIILKIPSAFIVTNGIEPDIEKFASMIKDCTMCRYMPDNQNNIFELDNYKQKSEKAIEKKRIIKEQQEYTQKRNSDILSGDIVILENRKMSFMLDFETITIDGKDYGHQEYFTNKLNVKKSFVDNIFKTFNTFDLFKAFLKEYFSFSSYLIEYSNEKIFKWLDTTFSCSPRGANLQCTLNVTHAQIVVNREYNRYSYRSELLQVDNLGYFITNGNDRVYFEGYINNGFELRKNK